MNLSERLTRVLCVDDSPDIAALCQRLVEVEADMECAGVLESADALVETVLAQRVDVVLLDLTMPGKDPLMAVREVAVAAPKCRVLAFSGYDDAVRVDAFVEAGGWGLVSKDSDPGAIIEAIRRVARGEFVRQDSEHVRGCLTRPAARV